MTVEELLNRNDEKCQTLLEEKNWKEYLNDKRNLNNYSYLNRLAIKAIDPLASFVRGRVQWEKEFGRKLSPNAKAIPILAPNFENRAMTPKEYNEWMANPSVLLDIKGKREDGRLNVRVTSFSLVYVYDVKDTIGKEIVRKPASKGDVKRYGRNLNLKLGYIAQSDIEDFIFKNAIKDKVFTAMGKQFISNRFKTAELVAESVAYCVCNELGVNACFVDYPNNFYKEVKDETSKFGNFNSSLRNVLSKIDFMTKDLCDKALGKDRDREEVK